MVRTLASLVLFSSLLAACGPGSLAGSASNGSSASSNAAGNLVAYETVRQRTARVDPMKNPRRRPLTLTPMPDYPFNDAIPFFPRGKGDYVSSSFGWRNLWGKIDFHCGTDVTAPIGTPIKAVTSGYVTFTRSAGAHSGLVMYNEGRQYTYWHVVPSKRVKDGTYVRAGQTIGTLANWGNNTHLHYGIYITGNDSHPNARLDTNCVDPMSLAAQGLF